MTDHLTQPQRSVSRKNQTDEKLRAGLHRLATGTPLHPANQGNSRLFTVAALSREAGVARNAIYTSHRAILDQLQALAAGLAPAIKDSHDDNEKQVLEARIRRLATDNAVLLKRALEAERRAERLESRCASLLKQRDSQLSITRLPSA